MKIENSASYGEYQAQIFEHPGFDEDFPEWMSRIAKKVAKESYEDFIKLKENPESCFADGRVTFEVKVSIINDP